MKKGIKLFSMFWIFLLFQACSQPKKGEKIILKEIGWTTILPFDYVTLDSLETIEVSEREREGVYKENGNVRDFSRIVNFLLWAKKKDTKVEFICSFSKFNSSIEGNYDKLIKFSDSLAYNTYRNRANENNLAIEKIDTVTKIAYIDGVKFRKFILTFTLYDNLILKVVKLRSLYNENDICFEYRYSDKRIENEIETMLKNSKFKKY